MAARLTVPATVALPCPPALAVCVAEVGVHLDGALPSPTVGEVLNVVSGTPDGKLVYAVAGGPAAGCGPREGWLPGNVVRLLEPEEAAEVPESSRLRPSEALMRVTLARVEEDWFDDRSADATLVIRAGEVLQVGTARRGWGYGWRVETPCRRGWFPLAMISRLPSSISELVEGMEEKELTSSATAALLSLLQSAPPPPPRQPVWQGDLPPVVAESAQHASRAMQEAMEQTEAEAAMAAQEMGTTYEARQEEGNIDSVMPSLVPEELPEDCYPLVVCKVPFTPPRSAGSALLKLATGDLARVTSLLEAAMYHGFVEGRPTERGWFPKRNVELLEDPLSSQVDNLPVHIGPPPLPQVPPALLKKRAMA